MASIRYTDPGEMRSLIDFLDPGVEPNSDGSISEPSVVLTDVQAKITGLTGRELFHAQQTSSEVTHSVIIRFPEVKIRSRYLIRYKEERIFRILYAMDPDEMEVELRIYAAENNDG